MDSEKATLTSERIEGLCVGFIRSLDRASAETRSTYTRTLREFLRWCREREGKVFSPAAIRDYRAHLADERRFAPASVSAYLSSVRRFLGYLVVRGLLDENGAKDVAGAPRPARHSRASLSESDVEALLRVVDEGGMLGTRDQAVIHLMVEEGLSEIEIVRANIGDVLRKDDTWSMRVQGKGRVSKDTTVTLSLSTITALTRYLSTRPGAGEEEPLFASAGNRTRGMRMTTRGIRDRVTRSLTLAGIRQTGDRRITPHSLRHTTGVMLARAGASAEEIQRRLRLGTAATAKLYFHQ